MPIEHWYKTLVDECAREKKNIDIDNGMPEHARYLIKKLFEISEHTVQIYCGKLKREVSGPCEIYSWADLISATKDFLYERGGRLEILIEKDIDGGADNEFINAIRENPSFTSQCEIRKVNKVGINKHFVVADSRAYRFETDDARVKAVANFNDSKNAIEFARVFRDVFNKSDVVTV